MDCLNSGPPDVDGLWVVNTSGGAPRQLAYSRCLDGGGGGIRFPVAFRSAPIWSPDGRRLLASTSAFEGSYYGILDLTEGTLRYPEPEALLSGEVTWSRDGQAVIGTDSRFLAPARLLLVDAGTFEAALLLDGQALNAVIVEPYRRADGQIAFWMAPFDDPGDPENLAYDLYLGSQDGDAFTYEQAAVIGIPRPRDVAWSADESAVAVGLHAATSGVMVISLPSGRVIRLDDSRAPHWGS
jgi:hypothetical protein